MKLALALAATATAVTVGVPAASASSPARNGRIVFAYLGEVGHFQIVTVDAAGKQRRALTESRRFSSYSPSYSPDGKRIVFVRAYKHVDLWTMNANGTRERHLTWTKKVDEIDPSWSPDGTEIVFAVEKPAALQGIWVVGADGRGRRRLTTGVDTHPSWCPDGSEIVFQRSDASSQMSSIFEVSPLGGAPTRLTNPAAGASDLDPVWSPDGSRILFSSDRANQFDLDLWVMTADGGDAHAITVTEGFTEEDAAWSPDGRKIVFSGVNSGSGSANEQLYVIAANGSGRHGITHSKPFNAAIANLEPSWQPLPG